MQLQSDSITDGAWKDASHALARLADPGPVEFSGNQNPHLRWSDEPEGTKSFVITVIDVDCPSAPDDVNQQDREVPETLPRVDFTHWLLADIPADTHEIEEGAHSTGVTARGKAADAAPVGKHGVNDYTSWFEGDPDLGGVWHGYDGAAPPWNDSIPHRYIFTVFAIDQDTLGLREGFTRDDLTDAMAGHVLDEASITVKYATNPRICP